MLALQGDSNGICCAHGGNGTTGKDQHLTQAQTWQDLVALHIVHVSFARPCLFHDRCLQYADMRRLLCLCIAYASRQMCQPQIQLSTSSYLVCINFPRHALGYSFGQAFTKALCSGNLNIELIPGCWKEKTRNLLGNSLKAL